MDSVSKITETFNTVYLIDNTYAEKLNVSVGSLETDVLNKLSLLNNSIMPNATT